MDGWINGWMHGFIKYCIFCTKNIIKTTLATPLYTILHCATLYIYYIYNGLLYYIYYILCYINSNRFQYVCVYILFNIHYPIVYYPILHYTTEYYLYILSIIVLHTICILLYVLHSMYSLPLG